MAKARFAKFTIWQTGDEQEQNEGMAYLLESSAERIGEGIYSLRSEVAAQESNVCAIRLLREDPEALFKPVSAF